MANQSNPSPQDDQVPLAKNLDTDVAESCVAPERNDAALGGRTYTVAGLIQAHVPQKSLGSYVKAG
jgi:hypothetical protein